MLDLEAEGLDADHREGPPGGVEAGGRLAHRLVHPALVGTREGEGPVPLDQRGGDRDAALDHVAMDLEVPRALLAPHRAHDLVDVLGGRARVVDDAGRAAHLLVDPELRLDRLRLMVDEGPEAALVLTGPAADDQHRHALGERARDGIHHVVTARPVGDAHDPDAAGRARIPVGGEAHSRLVRQRDDLQPPWLPEPREEAQDEVPRDAEQVRDPDLVQIGDEEVAERHGRAHGPARSATVASGQAKR